MLAGQGKAAARAALQSCAAGAAVPRTHFLRVTLIAGAKRDAGLGGGAGIDSTAARVRCICGCMQQFSPGLVEGVVQEHALSIFTSQHRTHQRLELWQLVQAD